MGRIGYAGQAGQPDPEARRRSQPNRHHAQGHYAGELVRRKHAWPKCPSPEHGVRRSSGSPPGPGRGLRSRCGNARGNRDTGPVAAGEAARRRLVGEPFAVSDAAVGVRKGEPEWLAWINAALARMKAENLYMLWVERWVPNETRPFYISAFNDPRPKAR